MSGKYSYEELEKRIKELEKEKEKNTRIEKEFEKRQKYLEAVFHNAPCAIVTLDSTHQAPVLRRFSGIPVMRQSARTLMI